MSDLHGPLLRWYDDHARELPWRGEVSPWAVLVSEVMLQQTPVARVRPVFEAWLERWPAPAALAADPPGEAIRMWGRLGYPRRALRLHAAAVAITDEHGGAVPADLASLRSLPGVGEYTAAAVAAFAFGERVAVLDTNVRRVLARVVGGAEHPPPGLTNLERAQATALLPDEATAPVWSIALMELGALVCTSAAPDCADCPLRESCAWRADGFPSYSGPARRGQAWEGTDRQCRGRLLAVLREESGPVSRDRLDPIWPQAEQRERCLRTLVADGLVVEPHPGYVALP